MSIDRIPASLQVYIVEDSPIIQRLLASTIEATGAELLGKSSNAQTAIAELSVLQPDLILIDIILDVGSGFDVLRAMQERGLARGAIKVVLTNHTTAEYEALSYGLGAHRFFDKGTETSQVLALIDVLSMEKQRKTMILPGAQHFHARNRSRC